VTLTLPAVELGNSPLEISDVVAVARDGAQAKLGPEGLSAMQRSAEVVQRLAGSSEPAYGISTGFGSLASVRIPPARREELQRALIRSHAAGMGPPVEREVVRAMMLLRARTLAMGYSGARPVVAQTILALLNAGITPVVPEYGSLGASGDLAPLAHCALALIGEGRVSAGESAAGSIGGSGASAGESAATALAAAGIEPLTLTAKEGLALINGTDGSLGMLAMAIHDCSGLLQVADITAAMSVEALLGTDAPFALELVALRPQPGQADSARNIMALLHGSPIVASHRFGDPRVQDAYSLRCAPQVAGAARDTLAHCAAVAAAELRSAIDNPMVMPDGRVASCGNFHGAPVGFACDFLAIAAAEVGAIAERRTDRLLDAHRSHGLPPFLARDPGVNSGLMIAHYTQASIVAENRRLAAPASVDSLPTSAMQEDHVSMSWGAARKLRTLIANLARILAVELVCAARGLQWRAPLQAAPGTAAACAAVRARIDAAREQVDGRRADEQDGGADRWLAPELAAAEELVRSGALLDAVQAVTGALA
jgi:histidine ammonia-lyase